MAEGRRLNTLVQSVISEGGEGVILGKLASPYIHGRTVALVKLKV